ncbi:MAG: MFS transporter [Francisellaceae bacterium]
MPRIKLNTDKAKIIWLIYESGLILAYGIIRFYFSLTLFEITGSVLIMALSVLLSLSPKIYLSFIAGRIIDRIGARKTLIITHSLLVFIYFAAAFVFNSESHYIIWSIFAIISLRAAISSFHSLSIMSIIPDLLAGKTQAAYALEGFLNSGAAILAPALAGVCYVFLPLENLLFIVAGMSIPGLFLVLHIIPISAHKTATTHPSLWQHLHLIMRNDKLRYALLYFCSFNAINGIASAFLSVYILMLGANPNADLATYSTIVAIATLIGSLYSIKRFHHNAFIIIAVTGILCALFGRIGIALTDNVILIAILVALRSALAPVANMANQMLWVSETKKNQRAGIFGLRRLIAQGSYPIIAFSYLLLTKFYAITFTPDSLRKLFISSGMIEIILAVILLGIFLLLNTKNIAISSLLVRKKSTQNHEEKI